MMLLKTDLPDVVPVESPNTIMEIQLRQAAYVAALSATERVVQPSLLDFLR